MNAVGAMRRWLVDNAPALGVPRRLLSAAAAATAPKRRSYSQHGEDVWLMEQLVDAPRLGSVYIDVGANHPSRISNTYLLYRSGFSGVVVEPNAELLRLHRLFRPRDIAIGVGCGDRARLAPFSVMNAPVLSTFAGRTAAERHGARVVRTDFLPILTLDEVMTAVEFRRVLLLSVDTEGHDALVLRGATATLARTLFVCVEVNDPESEAAVHVELRDRFELLRRFGCNLIWRNCAPESRQAATN